MGQAVRCDRGVGFCDLSCTRCTHHLLHKGSGNVEETQGLLYEDSAQNVQSERTNYSMSVHKSAVNFINLIADLADMYPFDVPDVIVVELVANALDARASMISVDYDPVNKILIVTDNGKGMEESQFNQYHDFAAGLKTRGTGIGFAGVGAKISFNAADQVITETRSQDFFGASSWRLGENNDLAWEDIEANNLNGTGTRVEVRFRPSTQPSYNSTDDLKKLLRRHYLPLFDTQFLGFLDDYGKCDRRLRFVINGDDIYPTELKNSLGLSNVKEFAPKKEVGGRFGLGFVGLAATEYQLGNDMFGLVLCTHGKVIKSDLFNQFPGKLGPRIVGVVEVPELVDFLTTSKTDFLRGRGQHKKIERLYGPIRAEFADWLASLGVEQAEANRGEEVGRLERELQKIVKQIPELSDLLGFSGPNQVPNPNPNGTIDAQERSGVSTTYPVGERDDWTTQSSGPLSTGEEQGSTLEKNPTGAIKASPLTRKTRRGPKIGFVSDPTREQLGWVEGNAIMINSGHPAYKKAQASASSRLHHNMFVIAASMQRFLIETDIDDKESLSFIDRMMAAWGSA